LSRVDSCDAIRFFTVHRAAIARLNTVSNTQRIERQLHQLWRRARTLGWSHSDIFLSIGWLCTPATCHTELKEHILSTSGWSAAAPEDYEPEDDPAEFIAQIQMTQPTLTALESELAWALSVAAGFGAEITRVGIGVIG
jgi:hypothetical protein